MEIKYSSFYLYNEIEEFLKKAEQAHPDLIKLDVLAKTPQGRNIYVAEVTDRRQGDAGDKSAYFIQACVHAQEGAGTTVSLYTIKQLLENEKYGDLLKNMAFYIIPRVNMDGAEYAITGKTLIRSAYKERYGKNVLIPKDINNDGLILTMRWEDPAGPMKADEEDPRIMVKRQPGDKGPFYQVLTEGMIENFEGMPITAKDVKGLRSVDFNRNYPVRWNEGLPEASHYPFSEPEMRAVGEFTLTHPNIFAGVDIHCGTNGILTPAILSGEMAPEDVETIVNLANKAEEMTGFPVFHRGEYRDYWRKAAMLYGSSNDWATYKLGISHYVVELGNGWNCAGISAAEYFAADNLTRTTVFMRRVMKYHDENNHKMFSGWDKFDHPQLGEVEIGGIYQGNAYYMYPAVVEGLAPGVFNFMTYHAGKRPHIVVENMVCETVGKDSETDGDIVRVRATVANVGGFSTKVMKASTSIDVNIPVIARINIPGEGKILNREKTVEIDELGALGDSYNLEWFINIPSGSGDIEVEAYHPRGGRAICKAKSS